MKLIRKYLLLIFLGLGLFFVLLRVDNLQNKIVKATVNNYQEKQINLDVKSAIAIDAKNGQVFYAKNANKKLPVDSMSKLITIYLTLEAIKNKKISWEQEVSPTEQIVKVSKNTEFSGVPLELGHKYTIRQLYEATLIDSANGPAMLLAETIGGSQLDFVNQMQDQVKEWGIKNAKIYTPSGLPNYTLGKEMYPGVSKNAENELSAEDMAIIVTKLITDFPEVINTTKIAHEDFNDQGKITSMQNWNWMLKGLSQYDANYPLDGLKTGTTDAAGACFAGTMVKNGRRIITIVMGAQHKDGNDPSRFTQTKKLLNYVFSRYQLYILKKNSTISGAKHIDIINGEKTTAKIVLQKNTGIWLSKETQLKGKVEPSSILAPQQAGIKVGTIDIVSVPSIKDDNGVQLPATVKNNVKETNFFIKLWNSFVELKQLVNSYLNK